MIIIVTDTIDTTSRGGRIGCTPGSNCTGLSTCRDYAARAVLILHEVKFSMPAASHDTDDNENDYCQGKDQHRLFLFIKHFVFLSTYSIPPRLTVSSQPLNFLLKTVSLCFSSNSASRVNASRFVNLEATRLRGYGGSKVFNHSQNSAL